jgi:hypothetical protein
VLRLTSPSLSASAPWLLTALLLGCGGGGTTSTTTGGGAGGAATSTSAGGSGGATSATTTTASGGSGGATTTTTTTSSTTTSSTTTTTTTGWPTCDAPEPGAVQKSIHQIWIDNPSQPTHVWVPGVYVTAVSKGACQAGSACLVYVQQGLSYADVAAGSQQAIKLFVSANTAQHFTQIQVGQKVDIDAHAWRYNLMSQDELLLQVNLQLVGCAKPVGAGDAQPVDATLNELMFTPFDQVGPLLVKVPNLTGTPQGPTETFGLYVKGQFADAGPTNVVSLSPYFLPSGAFSGLTMGMMTTFSSVTGVFGTFVPNTTPAPTYRELYVRTSADYPIAP